jgi:hypothetical protein
MTLNRREISRASSDRTPYNEGIGQICRNITSFAPPLSVALSCVRSLTCGCRRVPAPRLRPPPPPRMSLRLGEQRRVPFALGRHPITRCGRAEPAKKPAAASPAAPAQPTPAEAKSAAAPAPTPAPTAAAAAAKKAPTPKAEPKKVRHCASYAKRRSPTRTPLRRIRAATSSAALRFRPSSRAGAPSSSWCVPVPLLACRPWRASSRVCVRAQRITGSRDTTLVQFLMTLRQEDEIRRYVAAVLGSSPAVDAFAEGFIAQRDFVRERTVRAARHDRPSRSRACRSFETRRVSPLPSCPAPLSRPTSRRSLPWRLRSVLTCLLDCLLAVAAACAHRLRIRSPRPRRRRSCVANEGPLFGGHRQRVTESIRSVEIQDTDTTASQSLGSLGSGAIVTQRAPWRARAAPPSDALRATIPPAARRPERRQPRARSGG